MTNSAAVSGGGDVNTGNNTAADATHVGPPLQIASTNNATTLTIASGSSVPWISLWIQATALAR